MKLESFRFKDEDDYEYKIYMQLKAFSRTLEKYSTRKASLYYFSPEKFVRLFLLERVLPFPDRKMIKLLKFDNLFPPLRHSR